MALWKDGAKAVLKAKNEDVYFLFGDYFLSDPHVSTIAIDKCAVPADLWVGMGSPEDYPISKIYGKKVFRRYFSKRVLPPNSYFADVAQPRNGIRDIFRMNHPDAYFAWFHHSLGVALHMAVWMGFKKFHFVGLSPNGYENITLRAFMNEFARLADETGIDCVSCTEGSSLNGFMDYLPLKEALEISRKKVDFIL